MYEVASYAIAALCLLCRYRLETQRLTILPAAILELALVTAISSTASMKRSHTVSFQGLETNTPTFGGTASGE